MKKDKSFLEIFADQLLKDSKREEFTPPTYEFKSDLSHFIQFQREQNPSTQQPLNTYNFSKKSFPFFETWPPNFDFSQFPRNDSTANKAGTQEPSKEVPKRISIRELEPQIQIKLQFLINLENQESLPEMVSLEDINKLQRNLAKSFHPDRSSKWRHNIPYEMADINRISEEITNEVSSKLEAMETIQPPPT